MNVNANVGSCQENMFTRSGKRVSHHGWSIRHSRGAGVGWRSPKSVNNHPLSRDKPRATVEQTALVILIRLPALQSPI